MPKFQVMSVRDRAADAFGKPFVSPSIGAAIRSFSDFLNSSSEDSEMQKHPEDFDLYHLAEFDDETGIFACLGTVKQVAIGKDLKIKV